MSDIVLDNVALAIFAVAPLALGATLYALFGVLCLQDRAGARWVALMSGNLLGLALCLSIGILANELYYRFAYDTTDAFSLTKTTERWLARHYRKNGAGMRDGTDYAVRPSGGRSRVSFLGDSFTAGYGVADVEDRFANRIRTARLEWEIHVLAKNGWNTGDHLGFLAADQDYETDRLVLVYGLNDISDIDPRSRLIGDQLRSEGPRSYLLTHSYFLNLLYYRWLLWRAPSLNDYLMYQSEAYESELWKMQRQRLEKLRRGVEGLGGRLLVVTFPSLHDPGSDYLYRKAHENLGAFWRSLGVAHLDLLPVFEAAATPQELRPARLSVRTAGFCLMVCRTWKLPISCSTKEPRSRSPTAHSRAG